MDKHSFLSAFEKNSTEYVLPNGETIVLNELTAGQRGRLADVISQKPSTMHQTIVAMSLDFISDDDSAAIGQLPSQAVEEMAEKVLAISGLDTEQAEKN